ncbi:unnamed protein product, partial [Didymodactylos carnosus]
NNATIVDRSVFPVLFTQLYDTALRPAYCAGGFAKAGIYPYDKRAISKEKLLHHLHQQHVQQILYGHYQQNICHQTSHDNITNDNNTINKSNTIGNNNNNIVSYPLLRSPSAPIILSKTISSCTTSVSSKMSPRSNNAPIVQQASSNVSSLLDMSISLPVITIAQTNNQSYSNSLVTNTTSHPDPPLIYTDLCSQNYDSPSLLICCQCGTTFSGLQTVYWNYASCSNLICYFCTQTFSYQPIQLICTYCQLARNDLPQLF